jgi:uncharacterized protein involved in outer membrane biogenesis
MRVAKFIGWFFAGLLLLLIAAAAALYFGGGPVIAWAVAHPASTYLGRGIHIAGPLSIEWGAPMRIVAEDVHLANASWGSQPDLFSAKRLEIALYPRSLLQGPPRLPVIALEDAQLLLETSKKGERNWDFVLSSAAPKQRRQFPELRKLSVQGGVFTFHNGQTDATSRLDIGKLEVDAPDPGSRVALALDGRMQGKAVKLEGSVGALAELRNPTKPYPVKLDGGIDRARLSLDGTIAEPLNVAGVDLRLSLDGTKFADAAKAVGVPLPQLPDFRGTSELTGGQGKWALQALTLKLGQSDLEGGLEIDTSGKVPSIKANLTSSKILLADFNGLAGGKPASSSAPAKPPDPSGRKLPDTPIAVEKLPTPDADLSFDGTRVVGASGLPVDRLVFHLRLKGGEIWVEPLRLHTADGDVELKLHFTPYTRDRPPLLGAELDVRHVDLHKLLGRPNMPEMVQRTAGIVGGFAKLDSNGTSLRQFLARMSGDAGFIMENGGISALLEQLMPIDALSALGVYLGGDRSVPINCLVSRFDIKSGVATVATMLLDTSDTELGAIGNVNFADETLFLTFTPYNKKFTTVSLRTPVEVRGTFVKPDYHLQRGNLGKRLGEALGLGVVFPPAALLPLVDTGLGEQNACSRAYAKQGPPGQPPAASGSSSPP